jgi:hypothetical protein
LNLLKNIKNKYFVHGCVAEITKVQKIFSVLKRLARLVQNLIKLLLKVLKTLKLWATATLVRVKQLNMKSGIKGSALNAAKTLELQSIQLNFAPTLVLNFLKIKKQ